MRLTYLLAPLATALALFLALGATPAFAEVGPPEFVHPVKVKEIGPTHAHFFTEVRAHGAETTWRFEYAAKSATCEPPAVETGCSWALAASETLSATVTEFRSANATVHHLSPATEYYVRFLAKSELGEASEIVSFKTLPISAPDVPGCPEPEGFLHPRCEFGGGATEFTTTSGSFKALIETNGAETTYHFESAAKSATCEPPTVETGCSWVPFTSGATGAITVAEDFSTREAQLTGLSPETNYYARIRATNEKGTFTETKPFATRIARPRAGNVDIYNITATSARLRGGVYPGTFETHWRFESTTSSATCEPPTVETGCSWLHGPEGTITAAQAGEEFIGVGGLLPGLQAGKTYYVRLFAQNAFGESTSKLNPSFEPAGAPTAATFAVHAVHGESMRLLGFVSPDTAPIGEVQSVTIGGSPTGGTFKLAFEGQATGAAGSGDLTEGSPNVGFALPPVKGTGNLNQSSAKVTHVTASAGQFLPEHPITGSGIAPGTRISAVTQDGGETTLELSRFAEASASGVALTSSGPLPPFVTGEAVSGAGVPAGATVTGLNYLQDLSGRVTLSATATATAPGVALTANLPFDAKPDVLAHALQALPGIGTGNAAAQVAGPPGGPYTVSFGGAKAGLDLPQITADASGLTPSGAVTVATLENGFVYDTSYRAQYVEQRRFEECGWSCAEQTPSLDAGAGALDSEQGEARANEGKGPRYFFTGGALVGDDIPGLRPGSTYRYRLLAANTTPGDPEVFGEEQTLTVPATPEPAPPAPCPNQPFRTGPSAALPDCRAYEQITPTEKEGALEIFKYATSYNEGALLGGGGDRLMLDAPFTNWGSGPTAGLSPYFFSRDPRSGWPMTAANAQPLAGVNRYLSALFDPNLTRFAFVAGWATTNNNRSPNLEFDLGPPGGPYAVAASVPRAQVVGNEHDGWAAASADFSKLVLQVHDRTLAGPATATTQGPDLYEYSNGELRQANVTTAGATIGHCGAFMAHGSAEPGHLGASGHAVSADGSLLFFEAVPGSGCSEPTHLYMRTGGGAASAETLDLGPYTFLAANPSGSRLLLEARSGAAREVLLYDTESHTAKPLFTLHQSVSVSASEDLGSIYFFSTERLTPGAPQPSGFAVADLYRYDVSAEALHFLLTAASNHAKLELSPDGRYAYFISGAVAGLPGGGKALGGPHASEPAGSQTNQLYRYDSGEEAIECVSCASPFDPEPRLSATVAQKGGASGVKLTNDGLPKLTSVSADGDYAFFSTPAALLPSDVNGELAPEDATGQHPSIDGNTSLSSDVYEWRKPGLDGCAHVQGCLSLITPGSGGFQVLLLGAAAEGRDVFFYTHSQLLPSDKDTSGDIYDARIGGGFPEPPEPIHCEGDSCHPIVPAPNDPTPSSEQFHGAGNVHEIPVHHKHHKKHHRKKHKRAARHNRGGAK